MKKKYYDLSRLGGVGLWIFNSTKVKECFMEKLFTYQPSVSMALLLVSLVGSKFVPI